MIYLHLVFSTRSPFLPHLVEGGDVLVLVALTATDVIEEDLSEDQ